MNFLGNGWLTGRGWCLGEFGPIELEERGAIGLPWLVVSMAFSVGKAR